MAFHPLATFRKNQKFWMAAVILLCMVTFVLCAGVQGDFGSRVLDYFTHTLRGGPAMARLYGRNVSLQELEQMREQRNIASDYMREASRRVLKHVDLLKQDILKVKESERVARAQALAMIETDLIERLKNPRYFETGVKVDELLDFMIWRKEAARLGIQLTRNATRSEIELAIHQVLKHGDRENWVSLFGNEDSRDVEWIIRNQHYRATPELIMRALREEFEVRIAKLVLAAVRPTTLYYGRPELPRLYAPSSLGLPQTSPYDWRQAVTPEQYWSHFKQNRAETDYALLPLPVEAFVEKMRADKKMAPSESDLAELFAKYKGRDNDPASITPGFKTPEMVKLEWITADPDSAKYRAAAETILALQATPPLFTPYLSELTSAVRIAAGKPALEASLHRNYRALVKQGFYQTTHMTDAGFPLHWYTRFKEPPAVAAMLAAGMPGGAPGALPLANALGGVYGNQAAAAAVQQKALSRAVAEESQKRAKWFATMFLDTATPNSLMGIGGATHLWVMPAVVQGRKAWFTEQHLPFAAVQDALQRQTVYNTARDLVHANMQYVRDKLLKDPGNPNYLTLRLREYEDRYGLIHKGTTQFRNRYDVASDPGLKEFRESFEDGKFIADINLFQGRGGTEKMLKPDEFWKLFFDASEMYSIRNYGLFTPQAWPPVTVDMMNQINPAEKEKKIPMWDKAPMPILYWKTANEPARTPANLAAVRKEVEHAWYYLKARDYLLANTAKDIAEAVQKSVDKLKEDTLDEQSVRVGQEMLKLRGVAPMYPDHFDPDLAVKYGPYQLPKGVIPHSRPEMVKELLALRDLKEPITLPTNKDDPNQKLIESVNKLNKDLLARKVQGQQVQILTNQPMSDFYVTLVTRAHEPKFDEFYTAYKRAVEPPQRRDWLLSQTQEQMGQQFERELTAQLRTAAGYEITDPDEAKKFDELGR
jgi:hypothetical protein